MLVSVVVIAPQVHSVHQCIHIAVGHITYLEASQTGPVVSKSWHTAQDSISHEQIQWRTNTGVTGRACHRHRRAFFGSSCWKVDTSTPASSSVSTPISSHTSLVLRSRFSLTWLLHMGRVPYKS